MVTAIGTGLGSQVLELLRGDDKREPISYSASKRQTGAVRPCSLPKEGAASYLGPDKSDRRLGGFSELERRRSGGCERGPGLNPGGVLSDRHPDRDRLYGRAPVTPPGAIFAQGCGGPISGRYVRADLDRQPVAVTGTADDPKAEVDPTSGT